jgi:hypothetical protein
MWSPARAWRERETRETREIPVSLRYTTRLHNQPATGKAATGQAVRLAMESVTRGVELRALAHNVPARQAPHALILRTGGHQAHLACFPAVKLPLPLGWTASARVGRKRWFDREMSLRAQSATFRPGRKRGTVHAARNTDAGTVTDDH